MIQLNSSLHLNLLCSRPYQVPVVGGAGALLGDPHAETGKAAVFAVLAEVEGSRLAAGAGRTLHIHLQRHIQNVSYKASAPLLLAQLNQTVLVRSPCNGTRRHHCSLHFLSGHSCSSCL